MILNIGSNVCFLGYIGADFNAVTGEWVNILGTGIMELVKVTRSALQNAVSVAIMFSTTEVL